MADGRVKMFTWTKVAGNLMRCLNPLFFFFTVWLMGWVGQNVHLNQSCRKFDENAYGMPKSTKKIFSLFGQWGVRVWHARPPHAYHHHLKLWQENFLSPKSQVDFGGGGGGGYGMQEHQPLPPPPPQTLTRIFSKSKKSSWVLGWWWWGGGVLACHTPYHHPLQSQLDFLDLEKFDKKIV